MRQEHKFGEKLFLDWAGDTLPLVNPETGEVRPCYLFVGVLGASNYTYAEPTLSQDLAAFLGAHIRMFEYLGGCPALLVPDNVKVGIKSPSYYEPDLNPAYAELARHYGCYVLPTRPRKPRDKAKVENGVLFAERFILAPLRRLTFFSLAEVQEAVAERLEKLNRASFRKLPGSRKSLFLSEEKPCLRPLPERPFAILARKGARVHPDYHVELFSHYYSVPYPLVGEKVEIRYSALVVEVFRQGVRVVSHLRDDTPGRATTLPEHMPPRHRYLAEWTPERILAWGAKVGPATRELAERVMASRPHPALGFRSCMGILRLEQKYGAVRLEAACRRALLIGGHSYGSVKHILAAGLEDKPLAPSPPPEPLFHENLRGPEYFQN